MDMHWNAHGNIYCNNCLYIGKKIAQDKVLTQSNGMIQNYKGSYKKFSNFFLIMLPKVSYSPGPYESIAPNSAAKF